MKRYLTLLLCLILILGVTSCSKDKTQQSTRTSKKSEVNKTPIKHLGVNLDDFDPNTGMAGDFKFTKETIYDEYIFANYGSVSSKPDVNGERMPSPQVMLLLPLGTKVHSTVDGTIYAVKKLYSGDYSIQIDVGDPALYYELEHVINVKVKKGDKVKAGQHVAEVSTHNSKNNAGLGLYELGVLAHGNPPSHLCYFDHIDPKFKKELDKKILQFYKDWEEYIGNTNIYDEAKLTTPGCETDEPISDNNNYKEQS